MNRGTLILALALTASLLWAYLVSHPTGNKGGTGSSSAAPVEIWDVPLREVSRLTYNNGKSKLVIQSDWSAGGETPYLWVETQLPKPQPKKQKKAGPKKRGKEAGADEGMVNSAFKGNAMALKLLQFFAKATALRSLGSLENLDREEFGIPGDNHSLEVGSPGRDTPLRMEVGRNSYGNSNRYVHSNRDGQVYLMADSEFRKLSQAQSILLDRELLRLKSKDITRIDIRVRSLQKSFWRMEMGDWSDRPGTPEPDQGGNPAHTVEPMAAFSTSVHRLRVLSYLGEPEEALAELGNPLLELHLYASPDEANPAWLKLYQGKGVNAVGVSSHTRKAVSLKRKLVDSLISKARELVRGV